MQEPTRTQRFSEYEIFGRKALFAICVTSTNADGLGEKNTPEESLLGSATGFGNTSLQYFHWSSLCSWNESTFHERGFKRLEHPAKVYAGENSVWHGRRTAIWLLSKKRTSWKSGNIFNIWKRFQPNRQYARKKAWNKCYRWHENSTTRHACRHAGMPRSKADTCTAENLIAMKRPGTEGQLV